MRGSDNIILTGVPRSGTTLTCNLLNKVENTIALHEPMQFKKMFDLPKKEAVLEIEQFFHVSRKMILNDNRAITKHVLGSTPTNPHNNSYIPITHPKVLLKNIFHYLFYKQLKRNDITKRGFIKIKKPLSSDFQLIIKHPFAFTALLERLTKIMPTYAIIRNPISVLASWNSITIKARYGHSPTAENLDESLKLSLSKIQNRSLKQIELLDWFYYKYSKYLKKNNIIYYEQIIDSGGSCLSAINNKAASLDESLKSKNVNSLYNKQLIPELYELLLTKKNASYWKYYTKRDVRNVVDQF